MAEAESYCLPISVKTLSTGGHVALPEGEGELHVPPGTAWGSVAGTSPRWVLAAPHRRDPQADAGQLHSCCSGVRPPLGSPAPVQGPCSHDLGVVVNVRVELVLAGAVFTLQHPTRGMVQVEWEGGVPKHWMWQGMGVGGKGVLWGTTRVVMPPWFSEGTMPVHQEQGDSPAAAAATALERYPSAAQPHACITVTPITGGGAVAPHAHPEHTCTPVSTNTFTEAMHQRERAVTRSQAESSAAASFSEVSELDAPGDCAQQ